MKIGIGLPTPVAGYRPFPGRRLVEWAQRAEERGFSGLATIDRLAYASYDSLTTLAAAAGATTRIELLTNILIGPLYPTVLLAKATATIDQISGGRLTLGIAPGGRKDDFDAVGADFANRGHTFDVQLRTLHSLWAKAPYDVIDSPPVAPNPVNARRRVPLLIGGQHTRALRRGINWGDGFTIGGARPQQAAEAVAAYRKAWKDEERQGMPRIACLVYFSLGADRADESRSYLHDYYAFLGPSSAQIAESALRSEDAIRASLDAYSEAGVTELYFDPTTSDLAQVDRLADVVIS